MTTGQQRFRELCELVDVPFTRAFYSLREAAKVVPVSLATLQDWAYGKSPSPIRFTYVPSANPQGKGRYFIVRTELERWVETFHVSIPNLTVFRPNHKRNIGALACESKSI